MRISIVALLLILFLAACSYSPVPKGVLTINKMYPAVKDIMEVDEFINGYVMKDSAINIKEKRSSLYEQVFALHQTDRKQFFTSYTYYQQHPPLLKQLYDSLAVGLKKPEFKKADLKKIQPIGKDSLLQ